MKFSLMSTFKFLGRVFPVTLAVAAIWCIQPICMYLLGKWNFNDNWEGLVSSLPLAKTIVIYFASIVWQLSWNNSIGLEEMRLCFVRKLNKSSWPKLAEMSNLKGSRGSYESRQFNKISFQKIFVFLIPIVLSCLFCLYNLITVDSSLIW